MKAAVDCLKTLAQYIVKQLGLKNVRYHVGDARKLDGAQGECDRPLLVTPALEARLRRLVQLAPPHLPHNLAGIAAVKVARPELPQVVLRKGFETIDCGFHAANAPGCCCSALTCAGVI